MTPSISWLYPASAKTFPYTSGHQKPKTNYWPLIWGIVGLCLLWQSWDQMYYTLNIGDKTATYADSHEITAATGRMLTSGEFLAHWWLTMSSVVYGLILGGTVGFLFAASAALWNTGRGIYCAVILLLFGLPKSLLIPIAIEWFGLRGQGTPIFLGSMAAFVPIALGTFVGLLQTPREQIERVRLFGAGSLQTVWLVGIPNARPAILLGCIIAFNTALPVIIASEIARGASGIGYLMIERLMFGDIPGAYAIIPIVAIQNLIILAGLIFLHGILKSRVISDH